MSVAWRRDGARLAIRSRLVPVRVGFGLALSLPGLVFLTGVALRAVQGPPPGAAPQSTGQVLAVLGGSLFFVAAGLTWAFYRRRVEIDAARGSLTYRREVLALRWTRTLPLEEYSGAVCERRTIDGSTDEMPSEWYSVRLRGAAGDWIEVASTRERTEAEELRREIVSVTGGRRR